MAKKHDWAALVEAHARSGMTQKAFCEQHGLHPVTFCQARRKLLKSAQSAGGFVRVRPREAAGSAACMELVLGAMTLRFGPDAPPAYVAALVEALS